MWMNPMGAGAIALLRLFLLLSSASVLLHCPRHASAAVFPKLNSATDRSSLLAFKSTISLDPHGALLQWNDSAHFCTWNGVACGGSKHPQRVVALQLTSLGLAGTISPALANLTFLSRLDLSSNSFHGHIPQELGRLPRLRTLDLGNNSLDGLIPSELGRCKRLRTLTLRFNKLGGSISSSLASLRNCTELEKLDLERNNIGGSLPKSVGNLSVALQTLSLGKNYIEGNIPREIGNLVGLTVLDMGTNMLTGSVPASIGSLKNLRVLDLVVNRLSGNIPSSIGNLTELVLLFLKFNSFSGSIPASLGNCKNLNLVNLEENKLTGAIPKEVIGLSSLTQGLSLRENMLTGPIPPEIGNLTNSGAILLSGNKLSGEIPSSLGKCQLLEYLYLNRNSFRGSIPASLSALRGLRDLDLSQNNLSGRIPSFLGDSLLTYLNLSFNNFEGEVPTNGGIFANMSVFSVVGNGKLCGGNKMLSLPVCSSPAPKKKSHKLAMIISVTSGAICLILLSCFIAARYKKKRKSTSESAANNTIKEQHINVSYADLVKATNGFSEENLIGSGNFGSVYLGKLDDHEQGTRDVAVKVFNLQQLGALKSFTAECNALRNIRHRNLVKVLGACSGVNFRGNDFKAMIFEFMENGSLETWLHPEANNRDAQHSLNLVQRMNIAIDIASALEYLHHHGQIPILHCDLKPSNILLDDDMVAHLSDFGLARFMNNSKRSLTSSLGMKGTVGYIAPEYGVANRVSTQGDVYSYGILLMELFTGKRPTDDMFKESISLRTFIEASFPEQLFDVIDACMITEGDKESHIDIPHAKYIDCVVSVLRIALACTKDLPTERMEMQTVNSELYKIRKVLLGN